MEKKWHIVYTRFAEAENGDWRFSHPAVTDVPWWECPLEGRGHEEGADATEEIESWRYMRDFDTREEAEAALADFPIEEWFLTHGSHSTLWVFADGRRKWSPSVNLSEWERAFDGYKTQVERENEFGECRSPQPFPRLAT